jgi:chromosome condensin MukBEF complex kleisin-like MukF subunit
MKTVVNFRIDKELKDFLARYAQSKHSTISRILTDYIVRLKKNHAKDIAVQDLSDNSPKTDACERVHARR